MVLVNQDFFKHLGNFSRTAFEMDLQRKPFAYNIINSGKSLISPIYENYAWDINFASAIISMGINFDPNELLFGLYSRNKTILKNTFRI